MFEAHKKRKAQEAFEVAHAQWQSAHDAVADVLQLATSGSGVQGSTDLILKAGEHVLLQVTHASLVEDRVTGGHWQGGSHGVSFPIASVGGRSVRYRVGQTRGHYIQGSPEPTAIDFGDFYVTNQRAIFKGAKQSRESLFDKLIAADTDDDGTVRLSVSNRQKTTIVATGRDIAWTVETRLRLGIAQFQGNAEGLLAELQAQLEQVARMEPTRPMLV